MLLITCSQHLAGTAHGVTNHLRSFPCVTDRGEFAVDERHMNRELAPEHADENLSARMRSGARYVACSTGERASEETITGLRPGRDDFLFVEDGCTIVR
ncbi:hypothetical protein GCM10027068_22990 [Prescottella soli]